MRALIMAGGAGTRLGRGEKPLTDICGHPMIEYITDAFTAAGCEPVVVISTMTPMTANWCRAHDIALVRTAGRGFIEDMVEAVHHLEEEMPVIISVSDIPCISPGIIRSVITSYNTCGKDALSVWVPARLVRSCRGGMPYREIMEGTEVCPGGINILRGDRIDCEQEEFPFMIDEPALAINVNTRNDHARAEMYLTSKNGKERNP